MKDSIVLKTDASYKKDVGSGLSYIAQIDGGQGARHGIQNNKFVRGVESSTQAETLAVVFAVYEVLLRVDNARDYKLRVRTDCEYTSDKLQERYPEQPHTIKSALNLLDAFSDWDIIWIPRNLNRKADSLARSKRMAYEEGRV